MAKLKTNKDKFKVVNKEIPKDLESQVQSIRAFATVHNILINGLFSSANFQVVADSIQFIKAIHGEAVKVASEHKDAALIPELKSFIESQKEAKNGTKN